VVPPKTYSAIQLFWAGSPQQCVATSLTLRPPTKHLRTLHLIGALPLSGAVVFGRILKSTHLRPTVITYDRTGEGYRRALEV